MDCRISILQVLGLQRATTKPSFSTCAGNPNSGLYAIVTALAYQIQIQDFDLSHWKNRISIPCDGKDVLRDEAIRR